MEEWQLIKLSGGLHESAKILTFDVSNIHRHTFFLEFTELSDELSMLCYQLARDLGPARNELNELVCVHACTIKAQPFPQKVEFEFR